MNNFNEREEKKGGFWSALSGLFRGGSSAMGGSNSCVALIFIPLYHSPSASLAAGSKLSRRIETMYANTMQPVH